MLIVLIRALILYFVIIFSMRLMGKRQIGELQPFELVITILVSNIAALPIEDTNIPMLAGIFPILALASFELIVSFISLKSRNFRTLLSGRPMIIINNGNIDQKVMNDLRLSIDDLIETMHGNNIYKIEDIRYAIFETNGKISFITKFDVQPITPKILNIQGPDDLLPLVLISDGKLIIETVQRYNIEQKWIDKTLKKSNKKLEDVFLMTVDAEMSFFIVPKSQN